MLQGRGESHGVYLRNQTFNHQPDEMINVVGESYVRELSAPEEDVSKGHPYESKVRGIVGIFNGGGVRGVGQAAIIQRLCQEAECKPLDIFTRVGGTSIGSILAGHIASGKCDDAGELVQLFDVKAGEIFPNSWHKTWSMGGLRYSKYDRAPLDALLVNYWKDLKLEDLKIPFTALTTAYPLNDYGMEGRAEPYVFHSRDQDHKHHLLRHVAGGSASAPGYFDPQKMTLNGKLHHIKDGGLIENNPGTYVIKDWYDEQQSKEGYHNASDIFIGFETGTLKPVEKRRGRFDGVLESLSFFKKNGLARQGAGIVDTLMDVNKTRETNKRELSFLGQEYTSIGFVLDSCDLDNSSPAYLAHVKQSAMDAYENWGDAHNIVRQVKYNMRVRPD